MRKKLTKQVIFLSSISLFKSQSDVFLFHIIIIIIGPGIMSQIYTSKAGDIRHPTACWHRYRGRLVCPREFREAMSAVLFP